jgi:hypothetical protein
MDFVSFPGSGSKICGRVRGASVSLPSRNTGTSYRPESRIDHHQPRLAVRFGFDHPLEGFNAACVGGMPPHTKRQKLKIRSSNDFSQPDARQ